MKTFITTTALCLALIATGAVSSADPLQPIPALPGTVFSAPPMEHQVYDIPVESEIGYDQLHYEVAPTPLFTRVRYVDKREMHPCAVPKIIRVNDPCDRGCDSGCGPKCVYIQICVPPCDCETVKCRRHGDRVRYDYGKYAVDVRIKKDRIVVDYQK